MAYFGKVKPVETTGSVFRSTYTGDGSTTTYNLPVSVANEESIIATINGVTQQDSAYSTNGSQIIFSTAPALNDSIELRCISGVGLSYAPADGSVTTSKLADGTITAGKLASTLDLSGKAVTYGLTGSDMPAGSVLQVVSANVGGSSVISSSSTYSDTGISATITPSFSTSKILIIVNVTGCKKEANNTYLALKLLRNSTSLLDFEREGGYNNSTSLQEFGGTGCSYLDSPSTTSSTTYKIQMASVTNQVQVSINNSSGYSSITLMEIAA